MHSPFTLPATIYLWKCNNLFGIQNCIDGNTDRGRPLSIKIPAAPNYQDLFVIWSWNDNKVGSTINKVK